MQVNLTRLANGLRIVTAENKQIESVSLGIWVNTGSAYETADINGISHFVEHMVFKGTKKRTALQISEDIENAGGSTNAYTSREFTVFYAKMLKEDTELALDVLADLVMAPSFDAKEMAKEKEVVVQEIKQTNDDPSDIVFDYFSSAAFADQPLGRSILGTADLVRSFDAEKLRAYMGTNYAAENIVVAAAGNISHEKFVGMVKARMDGLRAKTSFIKAPQTYTGGEFIKIRDTEQAQVLLGFNGVDYNDELYYPVSVLSAVLGGGMSSRLFQEIREKRGLVYTVYSFSNSHSASGLFGIYAGLNKEEVKNYLPVVTDEIKRITDDYITDAELDRVKVQIRAGILMALESSSSSAEMIARQQLCHNRNIPVEEIEEKISRVSKDDVLRAARQVFSSEPTYTLMGSEDKYPGISDLKKMLEH